MSAREGCATALSAVCCRTALRPQPEPVRCVFDPAHAAELTIQGKDPADSLGLGRINHKHPLACAVAEGRVAAHHRPFCFDAAILSRMRSPMTSRSNCAKDNSTLRIRRPIELVVLNCWVTETNEVLLASRISTILAKSVSERVSRSIL